MLDARSIHIIRSMAKSPRYMDRKATEAEAMGLHPAAHVMRLKAEDMRLMIRDGLAAVRRTQAH